MKRPHAPPSAAARSVKQQTVKVAKGTPPSASIDPPPNRPAIRTPSTASRAEVTQPPAPSSSSTTTESRPDATVDVSKVRDLIAKAHQMAAQCESRATMVLRAARPVIQSCELTKQTWLGCLADSTGGISLGPQDSVSGASGVPVVLKGSSGTEGGTAVVNDEALTIQKLTYRLSKGTCVECSGEPSTTAAFGQRKCSRVDGPITEQLLVSGTNETALKEESKAHAANFSIVAANSNGEASCNVTLGCQSLDKPLVTLQLNGIGMAGSEPVVPTIQMIKMSPEAVHGIASDTLSVTQDLEIYTHSSNLFTSTTSTRTHTADGSINLELCSGDCYKGSMSSRGLFHGSGQLKCCNGEAYTYEGEWANGERHGDGVLTAYGGAKVFRGRWARDKRDGPGSLSFRMGSVENDAASAMDPLDVVLSGNWSQGKLEGRVTVALNAKEVYNGTAPGSKGPVTGEFFSPLGRFEGTWSSSPEPVLAESASSVRILGPMVQGADSSGMLASPQRHPHSALSMVHRLLCALLCCRYVFGEGIARRSSEVHCAAQCADAESRLRHSWVWQSIALTAIKFISNAKTQQDQEFVRHKKRIARATDQKQQHAVALASANAEKQQAEESIAKAEAQLQRDKSLLEAAGGNVAATSEAAGSDSTSALDLASAKEKARGAQAQLCDLRAASKVSKQKHDNLERDVAVCEDDIAKFENHTATCASAIDSATGKIQSQKSEYEALVTKAEAARQAVHTRVDELIAKLAELARTKDSFNSEQQRLTDARRIAESSAARVKERIASIDATLTAEQQSCDAAKGRLSALQQQYEQLEKKHSHKDEDEESSEKPSMALLNAAAVELRSQLRSHRAHLERLERELAATQSTSLSPDSQSIDEAAVVARHEKSCSQFRRRTEEADVQLQCLSAAIAELQQDISSSSSSAVEKAGSDAPHPLLLQQQQQATPHPHPPQPKNSSGEISRIQRTTAERRKQKNALTDQIAELQTQRQKIRDRIAKSEATANELRSGFAALESSSFTGTVEELKQLLQSLRSENEANERQNMVLRETLASSSSAHDQQMHEEQQLGGAASGDGKFKLLQGEIDARDSRIADLRNSAARVKQLESKLEAAKDTLAALSRSAEVRAQQSIARTQSCIEWSKVRQSAADSISLTPPSQSLRRGSFA